MTMNPSQYYQAGQLAEAIAAAIEEVKKHPADTSRRGLLCELLCCNGDLERADQHLDTIGKQDAKAMLGIALFRQLVRGETARRQFYTEGRVPEFLSEPTPLMRQLLEASIRIREGNQAEAAQLLLEAEAMRPKVSGTVDGEKIEDFRDLDDRSAGIFEVLTSTGKYYWIPTERVRCIEFRAPERPRDLLWLRAHMTVSDGPDGEVYLPTIYHGSLEDPDPKVRLGRVTDWKGGQAAPVTGIGLRTFLVGEEAKTILELKEVLFGDEDA
ncbi:MAG: type VI secretion system accessory protein TagJ [Planctomycetota bacterium]